jgi:hypothetical protein
MCLARFLIEIHVGAHWIASSFVTIQKAHVEDVNRARSSSLEQGAVANTIAVARNEPFTLPSGCQELKIVVSKM